MRETGSERVEREAGNDREGEVVPVVFLACGLHCVYNLKESEPQGLGRPQSVLVWEKRTFCQFLNWQGCSDVPAFMGLFLAMPHVKCTQMTGECGLRMTSVEDLF